MTAMEPTEAGLSGRMLPEFLSRTVPSSATCRAVATWAGVVTVLHVQPVLPAFMRLEVNSSVKIRSTASSR